MRSLSTLDTKYTRVTIKQTGHKTNDDNGDGGYIDCDVARSIARDREPLDQNGRRWRFSEKAVGCGMFSVSSKNLRPAGFEIGLMIKRQPSMNSK